VHEDHMWLMKIDEDPLEFLVSIVLNMEIMFIILWLHVIPYW